MKFAATLFAFVLTALVAADNDSISYETETITNTHSVDVTVTSCADKECTATVQSTTTSVVTATVNGVKTVYTTVYPVSKVPGSLASPSTSDDEITYVDVTSTPTVTVSTGIESTVYKQSTFTSCYENKCSLSSKPMFTTSIVTATISGVETLYTTVCPLTETSASSTSSAIAPKAINVASSSSSEEITYVDITSTPIITASTGIETTVYKQLTFTSVQKNSTTTAPKVQYANNAPRNLAVGAAGLIGIAAFIM